MAAADLNAFFDKISKLPMLYRILIYVGTIVLLLGLYIWLVHIPKTGEIATIKSNIDNLDREIRLAKVKAKNLKKLETDLAKAQQDLKFAIRLLPTTSEIPSLLKNITKLGNDSNLEFILFSPEKEVPRKFYVEIPVGIEVKGIYHDVAKFFDKVGKLDRIVNVVNVSMNPITANSTILRTSCKALTFSFREQKKAKSVPKKKK